MVETIKKTLNENQNIAPEVSESLMELIQIFNERFPDVDLTNLNERLKSLIIRRESMFLIKLPCQYNPHTNEILVNLSKFEDCDARRWMMRALLGVITAKDNYDGFNNGDNKFIALNEGYKEIITNYLAGEVEDNFHFDEMIFTNLTSEIIGENVLFDAFFNNGASRIMELVNSESLLNDANDVLNAYYKMNIQVGNEKQTSLPQIKDILSKRWYNLCAKWFPAYAEECPADKCYKDAFPLFENNNLVQERVFAPVVESSSEVEVLDLGAHQKRL